MPEPAPAIIMTGPLVCSAAARCSGFSPSKRLILSVLKYLKTPKTVCDRDNRLRRSPSVPAMSKQGNSLAWPLRKQKRKITAKRHAGTFSHASRTPEKAGIRRNRAESGKRKTANLCKFAAGQQGICRPESRLEAGSGLVFPRNLRERLLSGRQIPCCPAANLHKLAVSVSRFPPYSS